MFNLASTRNGVVSSRRWMSDSSIDLGPSDAVREAHVLAVDDSLIDRTVIEKLLKTTSCKEFLGLDEQQRTSVVAGLKIDLIITDYCMPGMTGYELLKKIKESTFKETPVVIMSSENVIARIDRCLEEGAEDFILKPVKLSDVKRLRDYMSKDDKSNNKETMINNKRKQMEVSSPPSNTSISMSSQSSQTHSPLSISPSSSTMSIISHTTSPSTPSSPCGPFDSSSPPSSPSGPSDSPSRRLRMTVDDEDDQLIVEETTVIINP
ncbi:hypothetical protein KSS87_020265 [Heliosperma pusillum]|nr:hypothetical protein KSS87_020265 [Heliosperma pusillum]